MKEYIEGYKLKEFEHLLKLREGHYNDGDTPTGFLTKFNKDGSIPVAFKNWGTSYWDKSKNPLPIYVFDEKFRDGWKLTGQRLGMSQTWVILTHPENFNLEIRLSNLLEIINDITIVDGALQGKFRWEANELIKE